MNIFKSNTIENDGDNWFIADCGTDNDGNQYIVTTDHVHASELHQYSDGAKADSQLIARLLNQHYGNPSPVQRNTDEPVAEQARRLILECESIEQLFAAQNTADRLCNDAKRNIQDAQMQFDDLVKLRRAQLEGATLYKAPPGAEWVHRATSPGYDHPDLRYIHVVEWNNATWMVAADGFRLHVHDCAGVPCGLYTYVAGHLLPAPEGVKVERQLLSIVNPDTEHLGKLPEATYIESAGDTPYDTGEDDDNFRWDVVGWKLYGGYLFDEPAKGCNYRVNQEYLSDALSIGDSCPQYGYAPKLTDDDKPSWSLPLYLFFENALAVIMPMRPAR